MRESINYNIIPLPRDNMNISIDSSKFLTNVSSNGYYGYQPQLQVQNKQFSESYPETQITRDNTTMEVQFHIQENCNMQIEHNTRDGSRKRRCCYDEMRDFKKRRQHDQNPLKSNPG